MKVTSVSAGVILQNGRILVCQRRHKDGSPGQWEFPGGKQEPGETAAECLVRECREELAISLRPGRILCEIDWPPASPTHHFTFFVATIVEGPPRCLEHADIRWALPEKLDAFDYCPADAAVLPVIIKAVSAQGQN